jgi:hypothetical protein
MLVNTAINNHYGICEYKTISKDECQQELDIKHEGFITVLENPHNIQITSKHFCAICNKEFYSRPVTMLGSDTVGHTCMTSYITDKESEKTREKRLAKIEAKKDELRKEAVKEFVKSKVRVMYC